MTFNNDFQEIKLDGFQIVSGEYFRRALRVTSPTSTIWPNSISFNKAAWTALHGCERVRIEVNRTRRCLLIIPVTEKDKDGIRWISKSKDPSVRKMECAPFTQKLYSLWGWDQNLVYRAAGRIVSAENKIMLLFDFNSPEKWNYKKDGDPNK